MMLLSVATILVSVLMWLLFPQTTTASYLFPRSNESAY